MCIRDSQCSILHARARKYISAAANMQEDTYRYALECVDVGKLARFASRLCKRELGDVTGKPGSESMRMLSALTPRGPMFFADTIEELCPRIYSVSYTHLDDIPSKPSFISLPLTLLIKVLLVAKTL